MSDQMLAAAVERLEAAYETARQSMAEENARHGVPYAPEEMRESSGRYILLDALTAIVQARAALAAVLRPVEGVVARPGDTLIFRFGSDVSPERFWRFKEEVEETFEELLPGVKPIFFGGGVEQLAIFRPGEDTQT